MSLAKNKAISRKETDLNKVIRSIFPLLQADAFRVNSQIQLNFGLIPTVMADEKELRQCILNLVRNGLEAMPDGGSVSISTLAAGGEVTLTVQDEGAGIPPEVQAKLGTPFLTTKEHGTGLGLAVCYSIAERHRARIEVETGPGGTAFHFIFNSDVVKK
ncbi:MAG: HAMP domain-containing sensor histidine kinase [Negativicutes bacterium]|nr:HAMP domain-containing sensor histidine kinase [Negativicutes bacterium]